MYSVLTEHRATLPLLLFGLLVSLVMVANRFFASASIFGALERTIGRDALGFAFLAFKINATAFAHHSTRHHFCYFSHRFILVQQGIGP